MQRLVFVYPIIHNGQTGFKNFIANIKIFLKSA